MLETLNWDLWLGPAAERPYHPAYAPIFWRSWIDFGTGSLGDMGCHILDPAFWVLKLGSSVSVEAIVSYSPAPSLWKTLFEQVQLLTSRWALVMLLVMSRAARIAPAGVVFRVLVRANNGEATNLSGCRVLTAA